MTTPNQKREALPLLPRWHHDHPERTARRKQSVILKRWHLTKRNSFPFRIMTPYPPIVVRTTYKLDAPALIEAIIKHFGIRHAFSSRELAEMDLALLGDMRSNPRRIGSALSEITGTSFSGYLIERIDDDRDGAVWWVVPIAI
jgi:hypothetical protein